MCEFKVHKLNDNSQIGEDIVIAGYSDTNQLIIKDIIGAAITVDSAFIETVNTLNQTLTIVEHPLIHNFITLVKKLIEDKGSNEDIEKFQLQLDDYKR